MRKLHVVGAVLAGMMAGPGAMGQSAEPSLDSVAMYGITRSGGQLIRYEHASGELRTIGTIRTPDGLPMTGIDAAAYIPGFQNLFAFWLDPQDDRCKLVYVDLETAAATIINDQMEGGRITGATAVPVGNGQWTVYAVQLAQAQMPFEVAGLVNLNPNNSPDNEFVLVQPNGVTITRDHLHADAPVSGDGTYYQGEATAIRFRPKGNGQQNQLMIDGEPYPLQNSNTYILRGQMTVRVFNDHLKNGKAMGHWWLQILSGTAVFVDDLAVQTPDRLVSVDHQTGTVTELFPIDRAYESLAALSPGEFYATHSSQLYRIDVLSESQTLLGTIPATAVPAMEYLQTALAGHEKGSHQLTFMDTLTAGQIGSSTVVGNTDLGTIIFVPLESDPLIKPDAFD
ncbi:MAG TPA: hypothetical protein VF184_12795 [Phycisphaeraceae bacterium]